MGVLFKRPVFVFFGSFIFSFLSFAGLAASVETETNLHYRVDSRIIDRGAIQYSSTLQKASDFFKDHKDLEQLDVISLGTLKNNFILAAKVAFRVPVSLNVFSADKIHTPAFIERVNQSFTVKESKVLSPLYLGMKIEKGLTPFHTMTAKLVYGYYTEKTFDQMGQFFNFATGIDAAADPNIVTTLSAYEFSHIFQKSLNTCRFYNEDTKFENHTRIVCYTLASIKKETIEHHTGTFLGLLNVDFKEELKNQLLYTVSQIMKMRE